MSELLEAKKIITQGVTTTCRITLQTLQTLDTVADPGIVGMGG